MMHGVIHGGGGGTHRKRAWGEIWEQVRTNVGVREHMEKTGCCDMRGERWVA